jgi:hypothetical protein
MKTQPNVSGKVGRTQSKNVRPSRHDELKSEILALSEKWQHKLDLGEIAVEQHFKRRYHSEDPDVLAETNACWHYHDAVISWYLPKISRMQGGDEALEQLVVHEHLHVKLSPMESHLPERYSELGEFAVDSLAWALVRMSRDEDDDTIALPVRQLLSVVG